MNSHSLPAGFSFHIGAAGGILNPNPNDVCYNSSWLDFGCFECRFSTENSVFTQLPYFNAVGKYGLYLNASILLCISFRGKKNLPFTSF